MCYMCYMWYMWYMCREEGNGNHCRKSSWTPAASGMLAPLVWRCGCLYIWSAMGRVSNHNKQLLRKSIHLLQSVPDYMYVKLDPVQEV